MKKGQYGLMHGYDLWYNVSHHKSVLNWTNDLEDTYYKFVILGLKYLSLFLIL